MTKSLNKKALVSLLAADTGTTVVQSRLMVDAFLKIVADSLIVGCSIKLEDFAHLDVAIRPPRMARNPRTNDPVLVPSLRVVTFRPGKRLKQSVNSGLLRL